jgi:hypothetical protein
MIRSALRRILYIISLLSVICAFEPIRSADSDSIAQEPGYEPIGEIDIIRIEELYHLVETLGDSLWPSFDIRTIPIAINKENKQELLLNHPKPSEHFEIFSNYNIDGQPVLIREGCTIFGPKGGGWATDIDGVLTAYVSVLQEGQTTDDYLSTLLHECFHVFQRKFWKYTDKGFGELPGLDEEYSALLCLESRIIHDILTGGDKEEIGERSKMFVAVRQHRRAKMPAEIIRTECREEFNEGTATYIQARLMELLAESGGIQPLHQGKDPHYSGYAAASERYEQYLAEILPPDSTIITFFHAKYKIGMAQCLLLDRVRTGWKEELRSTDMSQFDLLSVEFSITDGERVALVQQAKHKYGYKKMMAEQAELVSAQIVALRGYLEAPGRRYRIYYGNIPEPFKWIPKGPVHHVPNSLAREIDEKLTIPYPDGMPLMSSNMGPVIWGGGIERFEVGGMIFESKEVPVIFRMGYLEWIDTEPAADSSDLLIKSTSVRDDIYDELVVITDGFELRALKARVLISDRIVHVIPLPDE